MVHTSKSIMLILTIFLLSVLTVAPAGAATDSMRVSSSSTALSGVEYNPWSSSTLTHIEYNPWGMVTVRIPRVPEKQAEEKKNPDDALAFEADFFGPLMHVTAFEKPGYHAEHDTILQVPLFSHLQMSKLFPELDRPMPSLDNPFVTQFQMHQPLVSLVDVVQVYHPKDASGSAVSSQTLSSRRLTRARLLDSLVFCLYEQAKWTDEPGVNYQQWFNLPMVTTYAKTNVFDYRYYQVLETPFSSVLTRRTKIGKSETTFLNLLLATGYESKFDGRDGKWTIMDLSVATVLKKRFTAQEEELSVLEVLDGVLMFRPWYEKKKNDGYLFREYLTLPVLGPVWTSESASEAGGREIKVFPRVTNAVKRVSRALSS